eukprot:GFUD01015909.1.p1 GENE.GFUD01015909.1~~GFUD01015909.1.p1  ORF type:complete len:398 (-),score=141.41 GFUD01015909.1:145-1248(-)
MPEPLHLSSHPEEHDQPFPAFRQPVIVGHFSLDGGRRFLSDKSGLHYLVRGVLDQDRGKVRLDLNKGVRRAIKSIPSKGDERLNHLLRGVMLNREKFAVDGELLSLHTDIVCFRGLLTTLLCTPYERKEGWEVQVVRWRGTLYLLQVETEQKKRSRMEETERQRTMSSWGYKFEQYMASPIPGQEPDTEAPVDENEEFCCLFRTRVGGVSMVYGAEMDAYQTSTKLEERDMPRPDKFVEMKTSREMDTERQERNFRRYKLLKWWAQSFLVGTRQILCGWRDDRGLVDRLEVFQVKDIPKSAVEWKANTCANFLSSFLSLLKTKVTKDDLTTIHSVTWDPWTGLQLNSWAAAPVDQFLPDWYTGGVFK